MTKKLFITGTGTDVGKTFVTALLVKNMRQAGYKAGYYKAALSGAVWEGDRLIPGDAEHVKTVAGIEKPAEEMVSYIYETAVSPHLASELEGGPVELEKVKADFQAVCEEFDFVTAEGSGGIACPIRRDRYMLEDVIKALECPILLIAPAGLGTINDTILTVEYARNRDIPVKGVILNWFHPGDRMEEDNKRFIEEYTGVPVLACVKEGARELEIDPALLAGLYE